MSDKQTKTTQPEKSTLAILVEKVDKLETLFLDIITDPSMKTRAVEPNKLEQNKNQIIATLDKLQNTMEQHLDSVRKIGDKLSTLNARVDEISHRVNSIPHFFQMQQHMTGGYPTHMQQIPGYLPPHRTLFPQTLGTLSNPIVVNTQEPPDPRCMQAGDFFLHLRSNNTDIDGIFNPYFEVKKRLKGVEFIYNPADRPQARVDKQTFIYDLINAFNRAYEQILFGNGKNNQVRWNDLPIYLRITNDHPEITPLKDMDTFLNWVIDNEKKRGLLN